MSSLWPVSVAKWLWLRTEQIFSVHGRHFVRLRNRAYVSMESCRADWYAGNFESKAEEVPNEVELPSA